MGVAGFIAFTADLAVLAAAFAAAVAALAATVAAFAAAVAAFAALFAAFAILLAAVFAFVAASPQAIPRALIAKTADNAITFFILILLSSQKTKFY